MTEREVLGQTWYVVAISYERADKAKRAWERVERKTRGGGTLGILRMRPWEPPAGQAMSSGAPMGEHAVVAVTMDHEQAQLAERLLRDGHPFTPTDGFADAVIGRRIQVLAEQAGAGSGRLLIRRPESGGAQLHPGGKLTEPPPGKG